MEEESLSFLVVSQVNLTHGLVAKEMRNMQAEERLGLVAQEKDFLLVDEFGYGALDHALLKHNLELEIWFCSHGARFHQSGQLEVLSECVKTSDYVALERRLRAGADVSVPWLPHPSVTMV